MKLTQNDIDAINYVSWGDALTMSAIVVCLTPVIAACLVVGWVRKAATGRPEQRGEVSVYSSALEPRESECG